ncbi:hypothetical protein LTS15_010963 [Exophiala xenobiotica]|nr:hypothetical protein LTS15_010963 [Exophiala xenobiotica]
MNPRIFEIINRRIQERQRAKEDAFQERWNNPKRVSIPTSPPRQALVTPTENQVPIKPFNILGLPLEVRQIVLRKLLCTRTTRTVTMTWKPTKKVWRSEQEYREFLFRKGHYFFVEYGIETAILRTCVQLYEEGSKILQQENKFVAVPLLKAYFDRHRARIPNIPIWVWPKSLHRKVKPILTLKAKDHYEEDHDEWAYATGNLLPDHLPTSVDDNVSPAVQTVHLTGIGPRGRRQLAVSDLHQPPVLKTLKEWVWDHVTESNKHIEAIFAEGEELIQSGHVSEARAKFIRVKEILGERCEPGQSLSMHTEMQARLRWSCFRICMTKTTIETRLGIDYTRDLFYKAADLVEVERANHHAELALEGQLVESWRGYAACVTFRQAELQFILNSPSHDITSLLCKAALYAAPAEWLPPKVQPYRSISWVHHYVHGDDAENWELWNPDPVHLGRGWNICSMPDQWEGKFSRVRNLLREVYDDGAKWTELATANVRSALELGRSWPSYW